MNQRLCLSARVHCEKEEKKVKKVRQFQLDGVLDFFRIEHIYILNPLAIRLLRNSRRTGFDRVPGLPPPHHPSKWPKEQIASSFEARRQLKQYLPICPIRFHRHNEWL